MKKAPIPASVPRKDAERDKREAVIKDANKTNEADRDNVHGDGGTINLPSQET